MSPNSSRSVYANVSADAKGASPIPSKLASEAVRELIGETLSSCREEKLSVLKLSKIVSRLCTVSGKEVVLLIDEVDKAANYSAFMELLGMFRDKYLKRPERPTFQSVILASVYDIKNLKLKIRRTVHLVDYQDHRL